MNAPLHIIEGLTVTEAEAVHDYVQLAFGREIGISIYNEMDISPKSVGVGALIGKLVLAVTERADAIEIKFADGTLLKIDLHPQAYRGPEALQLNRAGYPPVIWN